MNHDRDDTFDEKHGHEPSDAHDKEEHVEFEHDAIVPALRTVAFPDDEGEERPTGGMRPKGTGIEMRREMTKEDKELAAAGYEHLEEHGGKDKKKEFENVDIVEHGLNFAQLGEELATNMDTKDASKSRGLTGDEAAARSARDGKNVLTPPKKKSAFRMVCAQRM